MLKRSVIGSVRRLARDRRGVSAVEFALVAPMMIGLYLGCAEIAEGVSADRKTSLAASSVANLTAQVTTISASDMTNILDAASAVIKPYDASKLKITVSCIKIDANKNASVKWSVTRNGTARSVGTYSFDSGTAALAVANTTIILGEASYDYKPTVGYTITGNLTLSDKMFMSPRISAPTYGTTTCT
ncbi:MAG: TadE/TadG family type IV pilus assembly protein [Pseudolabrys sp.]